MAHRFVYARPRLHNLAGYAGALAVVLLVLERWGQGWWDAFAANNTLFEVLVGWGFALYLAWFWLLGAIYFGLDRVRDRAALRPESARTAFERRVLRWEIQQPRSLAEREPDVSRGRTLGLVVRNQFLGTWPALVVVWALLVWRGVAVDARLPPWWIILAQLGGIALLLEVAFYSVHRALHGKALFRAIHRVHHEYRKPTGVATHHVHYVEHLCGNLLPVFLGPVVLGVHPLVFMIWVVMAVFNAIHTHGGYAIPGLPYAHDHDFHHYRLRGNYGSLGLLDAILGTNREFVGLEPERDRAR